MPRKNSHTDIQTFKSSPLIQLHRTTSILTGIVRRRKDETTDKETLHSYYFL